MLLLSHSQGFSLLGIGSHIFLCILAFCSAGSIGREFRLWNGFDSDTEHFMCLTKSHSGSWPNLIHNDNNVFCQQSERNEPFLLLNLVGLKLRSASAQFESASITSAEREVKDSRSSGMFQSCTRRSRSCFGISSRYLRVL